MSEDKLKELSIEFFILFSRAEYSLKAAGFFSGNAKASADWQKFSLTDEVQDILSYKEGKSLTLIIKEFLTSPPRKQVVVNSKLEWSDIASVGVCEAHMIILYINRVRNNLFHGGKFNGHWFEPERSELLLGHSLIILKAMLKALPSVNEAYTGSIG